MFPGSVFQVVEFALDADDNVIDRKVVPYPYPTRQEAAYTIQTFVRSFADLVPGWRFLVGNFGDGKTRVRFIIEPFESERAAFAGAHLSA